MTGDVVPAYKKGDKKILKNYSPISLLPVRGKISEKLIFLIKIKIKIFR